MSPHAHSVNREYLTVDGMWQIMERHSQYQGSLCYYLNETTVEVTIRRNQEDFYVKCAIEDIPEKRRRSSPVWEKWPQKMTMAYARRQCAKKAFPELFGAPSTKGMI